MSFQNSKKIINNYSYFLSDKIGVGCSSQVYKGLDEKTKQPVSVKVVSKIQHKRKEQIEMAEAEIESLKLLRGSANILDLKHVIQTKNSIYIVTQLCEKGTLSELLTKQRKFEEKRAIALITQIINGYQAIHSHNLVHRDLKPANILVNLKEEIKIGDFGFAVDVKECEHPSMENIGSPLYMPYESLASNIYSFKSDIWAIGITFLQLLTGRTPWKSRTQKQLLTQLEQFQVQKTLSIKFSTKTIEFLKRTLVKEVNQRMSPDQLFSFSFREEALPLKNDSSISPLRITYSQSSFLKVENKTEENVSSKVSLIINRSNTSNLETSIAYRSEESTQEHSRHKSNLHQDQNQRQGVDLKKKTTNSALNLNLENKSKESFNKKVINSLIELKESNPNKESKLLVRKLQQNIVKPPLLKEQVSKPKDSPKLSAEIEKKILHQIQSQVNYFRFLFKFSKKMSQTLKTNDKSIKAFRQCLLFFTHKKIEEIKGLQHLAVSPPIIEAFIHTPEYLNMIEVLKQYNERYIKEEEKLLFSPFFSSQKQFQSLLIYCAKVLYQNLTKIEKDNDELNRKKGLLFIVEDLVSFIKLRKLEQQHNWQHFNEASQISLILNKVPNQSNLQSQWLDIKASLRQLIHI